jgi:amino acid transporter
VIQTGSLALLAFVVGDYANELLPLGSRGPALYAALTVAGVTLVNWLGVREGTIAQAWLTVAEVLGLLVIVVAGLLFAPEPAAAAPSTTETAFGLVMVFVLLTFGGWNEAVYVSGELKDAPRHIARVLVLSLLTVTALYIAVNAAYAAALGLGGMAASDAVAADAMRRVAGEPGAVFISLLVLLAALSSANATAITGGRTNYALGRDVPALGFLGRWNAKRGTPGNALLVQGAAALLLVLAGAFARDGFQLAVEYSAPIFWFFFLLVGIALFVLRTREPDRPRPFRVPLYPLLPALFCATNAWLLYSSLAYTGRGALVGVAVLVIGGLLLLFLRPRSTAALEFDR